MNRGCACGFAILDCIWLWILVAELFKLCWIQIQILHKRVRDWSVHGVNTFNQEIKTCLNLFGITVTEQAGEDDQLLQLKRRISAVTTLNCPV